MMPPNKLERCVRQSGCGGREGGRGRSLPSEGLERLSEVLDTWLRMSLDDAKLSEACRASVLNSIEEGHVVGSSWFHKEDGRAS